MQTPSSLAEGSRAVDVLPVWCYVKEFREWFALVVLVRTLERQPELLPRRLLRHGWMGSRIKSTGARDGGRGLSGRRRIGRLGVEPEEDRETERSREVHARRFPGASSDITCREHALLLWRRGLLKRSAMMKATISQSRALHLFCVLLPLLSSSSPSAVPLFSPSSSPSHRLLIW